MTSTILIFAVCGGRCRCWLNLSIILVCATRSKHWKRAGVVMRHQHYHEATMHNQRDYRRPRLASVGNNITPDFNCDASYCLFLFCRLRTIAMAPTKTKVSMPGVAEGHELVGVPTGDDVSAEDRVKALFTGSMSADIYQVCGAVFPS